MEYTTILKTCKYLLVYKFVKKKIPNDRNLDKKMERVMGIEPT